MTPEEFDKQFPEFSATVPESPLEGVDLLNQRIQEAKEKEAAEKNTRAPAFYEKFAPEIAEISGSLSGAIAAQRYAPGILKVPASIWGGIVGATGGRAAGELGQDVMLDQEYDVVNAITKGLEAGTFEALGAGAFAIVGKGISAIRSIRAGNTPTPENLEDLRQLNEALKESGITLPNGNPVQLTPAQITESKFHSTLEKVSIAGITSGVGLDAVYDAQAQALKNIFDQNIAMVGSVNRERAGEAFQGALNQVQEEVKAWAKPKYQALDKMARNTPASFQSTEQWARNNLLASGRSLKPNRGMDASTASIMSMETRLPAYQEQFYKKLLKNERNLSFDILFDIQQDINKEIAKARANKMAPDSEKIRFYSEAAAQLEKNMEIAAKRSGGDVLAEYRAINGTYKEAMDLTSKAAVRELVTKAPEKVGDILFQSGNVTMVKDAFKAIDDAAALAKKTGTPFDAVKIKQDLKAQYVHNLLGKVMSDVTDKSVEKGATVLGKVRGAIKEADTFKAVLSKDEQAQLMKVLGWTERLTKESAGNFSLMVRGKQSQGMTQAITALQGAAGLGGFLTGGATAAIALAAIASPTMIARWAVSGKATSKLLSETEEVVKKFVKPNAKITAADVGALVGLVSSMPLRYEDVPDLKPVDGLSAADALMFQFLEEDNKPKGFPVVSPRQ